MPETGPYLKAAVICSDVIEGKDGVLSLIRIIDRLTVTDASQQPPSAMPTLRSQLKLALMFISGSARGTHNVNIRIERPDGTTHHGWTGTVFLEGEDRGANIIVEMDIEFKLEGLYWFDLYFDEAQMTRVPFRLIYQHAPGAPVPP